MQLRIDSPEGSRVVGLKQSVQALTAGRSDKADIHLPDPEQTLSRMHLSFRLAEGGVEVQVISKHAGAVSSNGPLSSGQTITLSPGDFVSVGAYTLTVERGSEPMAMAGHDQVSGPFGDVLGSARESGTLPAATTPDPIAQQGYWVGSAKPPRHESFSGEQIAGRNAAMPSLMGLVVDADNRPGADVVNSFLGSSVAKAAPTATPSVRSQAPAPVIGPVHVLPAGPWAMSPPASPPASPPKVPPRREPEDFNWDALAEAVVGNRGTPPTATPSTPTPPSAPSPLPRPTSPPAADLTEVEAKTPKAPELPPTPDADQGLAPMNVLDLLAGPMTSTSFSESLLGRPDGSVQPAPIKLPLGETQSGSVSSPTLVSPQPVSPDNTVATPGVLPSSASELASSGLDLDSFARGLGIALPEKLGPQDWEHVGRAVRCMVECFGQLMEARKALKDELRVSKTEVWARDNSPFKSDIDDSTRLNQVLFNLDTSGMYMGAERAIRGATEDLLTHNLAILAASRACVEGLVQEFQPQRLQTLLTSDKKALFALLEHARLWQAYSAYYGKKSTHLADWLERLYDEHFVAAYSREAERLSQQHIPLP